MRIAAIGFVAVAAMIGTPVLAADMALKAPPPSPAPIYSWTGFLCRRQRRLRLGQLQQCLEYFCGKYGWGWEHGLSNRRRLRALRSRH
jgi:hypothetical protein